VKGLTQLHPDVPEELRGTYAGLAHPAITQHLTRLGVTAVELMPVHQFVHDPGLLDRGLRNYWGYHTLAFFAPHAEYASAGAAGQQVSEFKAMVRSLHAAGLEVILDVVYNHTAEGNHLGPTLSFKGIDNSSYYRLVSEEPSYYMDYTGAGNSLNVRQPYALQLITDSLRYWATEMRVDGFRFDLAATLAREFYEADGLTAFFDVLRQDPVLAGTKLIGEPWDIGAGDYQVEFFPAPWTEWNGKFRDVIRDYWRGEQVPAHDMAQCLGGWSQHYSDEPSQPYASVNFVTAHDGFTLRDLVSYNESHNDANGEDGNDGERYNRSWNHGVEGPTDDPTVLAERAKTQRNFLATLLLSQGVPMLLHGDEIGRTQRGNNNSYAQDNELAWLDWAIDEDNDSLLQFARRAIALRKSKKVLRRRFLDIPPASDDPFDIQDAVRLSDRGHGAAGAGSTHGIFLNGHPADGGLWSGGDIGEEDILVLLNASSSPAELRLPPATYSPTWTPVLSTISPNGEPEAVAYTAGERVSLAPRSLLVLEGPRRTSDASPSAPSSVPATSPGINVDDER
jgi:glycogen operon protein